MQFLPLTEVEQIVRLLVDVGDPTVERTIADRKQLLLDGVCRLVGADVYMWSIFKIAPASNNNLMPVSMVDGGWRDPRERARLFEVLLDPKFIATTHNRVLESMTDNQHRTFLREAAIPTDVWEKHGHTWLEAGFEQFVLTIYPLGQNWGSCIGFHRRRAGQPFNERDRLIVHLIVQQVDWLHRHGTDAPAGEHLLELSPRERQVMLLLMHGESQKEIASQMKLSTHTVGDYIKQINKRFGVSSRAELLSQFISGTKK